MNRSLRIEFPGAWHHVMNRGRRSERVFECDADYPGCVALLQEAAGLWEVRTGGFCLMADHHRLLIHAPLGNLSRFTRHVNGVYTQRYEMAHGHDGQPFRGRFKAVDVHGDSYLPQLVRYIHRNPVRAGIADRPESWRWSSHPGYLCTASEWDWLHKEFILSILRFRKSAQRAAYRRYMSQQGREKITHILSAGK